MPIGGGKDACLRHGVRKGLDGAGASVDADGGKKLFLGGFLVSFHQFEDGLGAVVVRRIIHRAVQLFQFRGKRLVIQFAGADITLELQQGRHAGIVLEGEKEFRESFQSPGIVVIDVMRFRQVELDGEVGGIQFLGFFQFSRAFSILRISM
ncbi:MAG: hypothetical protein ACLT38_08730 [Akkermansia sp.]